MRQLLPSMTRQMEHRVRLRPLRPCVRSTSSEWQPLRGHSCLGCGDERHDAASEYPKSAAVGTGDSISITDRRTSDRATVLADDVMGVVPVLSIVPESVNTLDDAQWAAFVCARSHLHLARVTKTCARAASTLVTGLTFGHGCLQIQCRSLEWNVE